MQCRTLLHQPSLTAIGNEMLERDLFCRTEGSQHEGRFAETARGWRDGPICCREKRRTAGAPLEEHEPAESTAAAATSPQTSDSKASCQMPLDAMACTWDKERADVQRARRSAARQRLQLKRARLAQRRRTGGTALSHAAAAEAPAGVPLAAKEERPHPVEVVLRIMFQGRHLFSVRRPRSCAAVAQLSAGGTSSEKQLSNICSAAGEPGGVAGRAAVVVPALLDAAPPARSCGMGCARAQPFGSIPQDGIAAPVAIFRLALFGRRCGLGPYMPGW
jgi:hypothetical protein